MGAARPLVGSGTRSGRWWRPTRSAAAAAAAVRAGGGWQRYPSHVALPLGTLLCEDGRNIIM